MPWSLTLLLLAVCLIDGILTLLGQGPKYWADYRFVSESDPIGRYILRVSPHLFTAALLAWAGILALAMRMLPLRFSLPAGLFFFVCHMSGSSSWIPGILRRRLGLHWIAARYLDYSFGLALCVPAAYIAYRYVRGGPEAVTPTEGRRRRRATGACALVVGLLALIFVAEPFVFGTTVTIFDAIKADNTSLVSRMLDANPALANTVDERRGTPLHAAMANRREEIIQLLLDRGADVNAAPGEWSTPLFGAIMGGRRRIFEIMLDAGADVNARDESGDTALHRAVWEGDAYFVERLLEAGAEADAIGHMDGAPLCEAVRPGRLDLAILLLEHGADPDAGRGSWSKPLCVAAQRGDLHSVKLLLDHGADIHANAAKGEDTPLHGAASDGHLDVVRFLVQRGAEINAKGVCGSTPLQEAIRGGHEEVVGFLLENGARIDVPDEDGTTPLQMAVVSGDVAVIDLLVSHGAPFDPKDVATGTALLHDAALRSHKDLVDWLVERGAKRDIFVSIALKTREAVRGLLSAEPGLKDAVSPVGGTPLHWAALAGDAETAEFLVSLGANVNAKVQAESGKRAHHRMRSGDTPLDAAVRRLRRVWPRRHRTSPAEAVELQRTQLGIVRLLIDNGADVNAAGGTALHLAANLGANDILELLLESGADPNAGRGSGGTSLQSAVSIHNLTGLEMLLESGADPSAAAKNGATPLHRAVGNGFLEGAELLLKYGADICTRDKDGRTPLHVAARLGRQQATEFLVEHGADLQVKDCRGRAPLHLAAADGHEAVVKMLLSQGAKAGATDAEGRTALHFAAGGVSLVGPDDKGWPSIRQVRKVVETLLAAGVDVDVKDAQNRTPLHTAAEQGSPAIVELLLSLGADANALDKKGRSPLDAAEEAGHSGIVELLRGHRGDVESETPEAQTGDALLPSSPQKANGSPVAAQPKTTPTPASQVSRDFKVVHVFVALCDNKHQGIVPVSAELGNGQAPRTNLYWGAMYGVKTFFGRSPHWDVRVVDRPVKKPAVLERVLMISRGLKLGVIVLADAYDGAHMKEALQDFFNAASGRLESEVTFESGEKKALVSVGGAADLVCFVGHNGLMDVTLEEYPERRGTAGPKGAIVLACRSQAYFQKPLRRAGCHLLLGTTGLMAPEAYTLDAAVRSWAAGDAPETIRLNAAKAYAKYQRIGERAALRLFAADLPQGK